MERISSNLPNDNMQYYLRERSRMMTDVQNSISSQSRILNLRDDPIGAAHATRHNSFRVRLERYSENIETITARNRIAEGYMTEATELLQRARELAIQAANGTYSAEDLGYMSMEVDQILNEVVELANARDADGSLIFSGDRSTQIPFQAIQGILADGERRMITEVRYTGTINEQYGQIAESTVVQTNFPGNQVFWAENQQLFSAVDASEYRVADDTEIFIDGERIELRAGDTVFTIMDRINGSDAAVKARLDPVNSGLILETTTPHQMWLQDAPDGSVFRDLGILGRGDAPNNINPDALLSGGSIFDTLIAFRDELSAADQEAIGGRVLGSIDQSLDSMVRSMARLGAVNSRLEASYSRNEIEIPEVLSRESMETDVDFAEAITELKLLEYTHRASLGVASRIIQPTLLDFLR